MRNKRLITHVLIRIGIWCHVFGLLFTPVAQASQRCFKCCGSGGYGTPTTKYPVAGRVVAIV